MPITLGIRGHELKSDTPNQLVEAFSKADFKCVHLAPTKSFPELLPADKKLNPGLSCYIYKLFEKFNMSLSVLGCYTNIIDPDKERRQANINLIKNYLYNSRFMGGIPVATETGNIISDGYSELNFKKEAFNLVVESVSEICRYAESIGAIFAIEAGRNHPIYSIETLQMLVDKVNSPNLKIVLDLSGYIYDGNVNEQEIILDRIISLFGSEIVAFHLKDFSANSQGIVPVPIGKGQLNIKNYLEKISKTNPNAFVTIEGIGFEAAVKGKELVKDIMNRIDE
ncbi:sugar phosphate isomerase/epimerase family protein [Latilactobacillus sakei]|uniref:sugar phosphate isomerase/epimerase family protein n=1 Tax=Latilactobacillus sakei TaxID=1599 RepID=UPI000DC6491F|nr:sugar phosphate isomerase/epimerase [Latilactobacillus sakei]SPS04037.1 Xylose isomerase-like TIM barrel [Latilactobacillus sakei]